MHGWTHRREGGNSGLDIQVFCVQKVLTLTDKCLFVCLFVWALEIPVMVLPFFRELAQAQEVALVPLYQVLPVEFRHEPGLETNIPNS